MRPRGRPSSGTALPVEGSLRPPSERPGWRQRGKGVSEHGATAGEEGQETGGRASAANEAEAGTDRSGGEDAGGWEGRRGEKEKEAGEKEKEAGGRRRRKQGGEGEGSRGEKEKEAGGEGEGRRGRRRRKQGEKEKEAGGEKEKEGGGRRRRKQGGEGEGSRGEGEGRRGEKEKEGEGRRRGKGGRRRRRKDGGRRRRKEGRRRRRKGEAEVGVAGEEQGRARGPRRVGAREQGDHLRGHLDILCASWRQELGEGREALVEEVVSLRHKLEVIERTRKEEGTGPAYCALRTVHLSSPPPLPLYTGCTRKEGEYRPRALLHALLPPPPLTPPPSFAVGTPLDLLPHLQLPRLCPMGPSAPALQLTSSPTS